jgi:hypothetical protein
MSSKTILVKSQSQEVSTITGSIKLQGKTNMFTRLRLRCSNHNSLSSCCWDSFAWELYAVNSSGNFSFVLQRFKQYITNLSECFLNISVTMNCFLCFDNTTHPKWHYGGCFWFNYRFYKTLLLHFCFQIYFAEFNPKKKSVSKLTFLLL